MFRRLRNWLRGRRHTSEDIQLGASPLTPSADELMEGCRRTELYQRGGFSLVRETVLKIVAEMKARDAKPAEAKS